MLLGILNIQKMSKKLKILKSISRKVTEIWNQVAKKSKRKLHLSQSIINKLN